MESDAAGPDDADEEEPVSAEELHTRMLASIKQKFEELQALLGDEFYGITTSWESAASYGDHPDPRFREAALYLLHMIWGKEPGAEVALARAGLTDPSEHIRELALQWLTFSYLGRVDPNVSTILARVVMDQKAPLQLRGRAYEMFCMARKIDLPREVYDAIDAAKHDLPPEVDLTLVKVFAAG